MIVWEFTRSDVEGGCDHNITTGRLIADGIYVLYGLYKKSGKICKVY